MATREGYFYQDHRASPGLTEAVARRTGAPTGEKLFEGSTLTCSHCRTVQVKNPLRTRERAYCPKCDHYICDLCEHKRLQPDYVHLPFAKIVDIVQSATSLGSPMGLLLAQV